MLNPKQLRKAEKNGYYSIQIKNYTTVPTTKLPTKEYSVLKTNSSDFKLQKQTHSIQPTRTMIINTVLPSFDLNKVVRVNGKLQLSQDNQSIVGGNLVVTIVIDNLSTYNLLHIR